MSKVFIPATGIEKHFFWLSTIPHGSYNEQALSDALCARVRAAGLEAIQDALGNVLVRKPAAPGCEHKPPVLLQAHMDMVCTKVPGSTHDFLRDPLDLKVDDDGNLFAEGTSLGSDDGYGCAYMLELLLTDTVKHPELECLFTVQEEVGLIGAANFDTSIVRSRRMISMDSGGEHVATVSTAGGRRLTFTLPTAPASVSGKTFLLNVTGLQGGHSGGLLNLRAANAIKVLCHALLALDAAGVGLIEASGGEADNTVPRYASALLRIPEDRLGDAQAIVAAHAARIAKLYSVTDPGFSMTLTEAATDDRPACSLRCAALPVALFNGVHSMDPSRPDVLALSCNLGVFSVADGALKAQCMLRSANPEYRDLLCEQLLATASAFGASCATDSDYPGMEYNPRSEMRRLFGEVVQEVLGRELLESATHGGMEIGYFSRRIPDLDIVTLGPNGSGAHSPSETLNLESFNRMYGVLTKLIERL